MVSVLESHEALRDLEEVGVGLIRRKVDREGEGAVGADLLLGRGHLEWVFDDLIRGLVVDGKEGPVDCDREAKLVLES